MTKFFIDHQTEQGPFEEGKAISCQFLDTLPFILKESKTNQKYFCTKKCLVEINGVRTFRKKRYVCKNSSYEHDDLCPKFKDDTFLEFDDKQIY